jgi:hypothetical protein
LQGVLRSIQMVENLAHPHQIDGVVKQWDMLS